jgi:peptide/nickel transport system ATP-binding protein
LTLRQDRENLSHRIRLDSSRLDSFGTETDRVSFNHPEDSETTCGNKDGEPKKRALLEVSHLKVHFETDDGLLKAVDDVSFHIDPGEALGLVGESGCGKSVTACAILKLLESPPARYGGGEVRLNGENLLEMDSHSIRQVRGKTIAMVFQEPMSSLNPIMSIGAQIAEALREHETLSRREAREMAIEMLRRVGIPSPEHRIDEYPHQLSGGMKQRAMIAMALVCKPQLLIADEPTTALDVTIQAQILDLLSELRSELQMSLLLITHDLGVIAQTCDSVAVMYAGKIVEYTTAQNLFARPCHPYTHGLFRAMPSLNDRKELLEAIPGVVPSPLDFPSGCRFRTRCWMAQDECKVEPPLRAIESEHQVACHYAEQLAGRSLRD